LAIFILFPPNLQLLNEQFDYLWNHTLIKNTFKRINFLLKKKFNSILDHEDQGFDYDHFFLSTA
jgi:hypothetical protein